MIDEITLSDALQGTGLGKADAEHEAEFLLQFFGLENEIIDNILYPDERSKFVEYEIRGIVRTARDETTLHTGKVWRINYWILNTEKINELAAPKYAPKPQKQDLSSMYKNLSDENWDRSASAHV